MNEPQVTVVAIDMTQGPEAAAMQLWSAGIGPAFAGMLHGFPDAADREAFWLTVLTLTGGSIAASLGDRQHPNHTRARELLQQAITVAERAAAAAAGVPGANTTQ